MGVIDEIIKMQNQGKSDAEIARTLKEQKVSPKEIEDAMNQARIKNAVSQNQTYYPQEQESEAYYPQEQNSPPQPNQQDYYQQEYYPQETYQDYSAGSDTMVEIAEQVFFDKMKDVQKQIENLSEMKTLMKSKIQELSERLKRIETTIDKLQISILDKVGSYGDNLENIKKEMNMMQDSFGKMIGNISERKPQPSLDERFTPETPTRKKVSRKK